MKQVVRISIITIMFFSRPADAQSVGDASPPLEQIYDSCAPFLTPHQLKEYANCPDNKKDDWIRINCIGVDRNAERYGMGHLSATEQGWFNNCKPYMTPAEKQSIQQAPTAARRHWLGRHCLTPMMLPGKPSLADTERTLLMTLPLPMMRYNFMMAHFDGLLSQVISCRDRVTSAQFEAFFHLPTIGTERSDWLSAHCTDDVPPVALNVADDSTHPKAPDGIPSGPTDKPGSPFSNTKGPSTLNSTVSDEVPSRFFDTTRRKIRATEKQKKKLLKWRILGHIIGWSGLTNIGLGLGLGLATKWHDDYLQSAIISLSVGVVEVIGAAVMAVRYMRLKRRVFWGYLLPNQQRSGARLGVGFAF